MTLPRISFEGRLIADPELRFTNSGVPFATLRVATSDRKKDDNGVWVDGETTFLNLNVWRRIAENCAESLHKGDNIVCIGKVGNRQYTDKEGQTRLSTDVEVESIGLSLRFESFEQNNTKPKADKTWADEAPPF